MLFGGGHSLGIICLFCMGNQPVCGASITSVFSIKDCFLVFGYLLKLQGRFKNTEMTPVLMEI